VVLELTVDQPDRTRHPATSSGSERMLVPVGPGGLCSRRVSNSRWRFSVAVGGEPHGPAPSQAGCTAALS